MGHGPTLDLRRTPSHRKTHPGHGPLFRLDARVRQHRSAFWPFPNETKITRIDPAGTVLAGTGLANDGLSINPVTEVAKVVRLGGVNVRVVRVCPQSGPASPPQLFHRVLPAQSSTFPWLGGVGAWPQEGLFTHRLRSLDELADIAVLPRSR